MEKDAKTKPDYSQQIQVIRDVLKSVREKPGMYVGSPKLWGFVNYIVAAFDLLLAHGAKTITMTVSAENYCLDSDACLIIHEDSEEKLWPFEVFADSQPARGFDGCILAGLSSSLRVVMHEGTRRCCLEYENGVRRSLTREPSNEPISTRLEFVPGSYFEVRELPLAAVESYLRRISHLFPGVAFRLVVGDRPRDFLVTNGVVDLFRAITTPFQIMHEPVHISSAEGKLQLEAIFAFHSWKEDCLWGFVNNGRAVEGGTHEDGFWAALNEIRAGLQLTEGNSIYGKNNGVLAVMSLIYPDTVWEGCVKHKIANPELEAMVSKLIKSGFESWRNAHPEDAGVLGSLQTFQFPEMWLK